jgi:capsular polysaccharide transport system ATP-binding protein
MIEIDGVSKWYDLPRGGRHHVYRDLSLALPARTNIGILGRNGAGKSTLIRMLAGIDPPSAGEIRCQGRISPPIGVSGGLSSWLTGSENARFVCRIFGDSAEVMARRLQFIKEFAQLDHYFEQPIRTYSSGMRARFGFAVSMAFDYDYYLIDEVTAVGDERFRRRANAMFASKRGVAGILLVSHNVESLREQCRVGLHIHDGEVHYFDDIEDAIRAYRKDNR